MTSFDWSKPDLYSLTNPNLPTLGPRTPKRSYGKMKLNRLSLFLCSLLAIWHLPVWSADEPAANYLTLEEIVSLKIVTSARISPIGDAIAYLITLKSVSIQGMTVYNLRALILPNIRADKGLLGVNFLDHFKTTFDSKKMVLERK